MTKCTILVVHSGSAANPGSLPSSFLQENSISDDADDADDAKSTSQSFASPMPSAPIANMASASGKHGES